MAAGHRHGATRSHPDRSVAKGGWRAWRVPARSVLDGSEPGGKLQRVGDEEGWK